MQLLDRIIELIFGCQHNSYEISKVSVEQRVTFMTSNMKEPVYLVQAKCNDCGEDCNHMLMNPSSKDFRVVNACVWLDKQGQSFSGGTLKKE